MEIKLYFKMLKNSWWIIALTTLAAVVVALIASYFTTPIYRATTRFLVSPNPSFIVGEGNVLESLATLDRRSIITTYAEILMSPRIHDDTTEQLKINEESLVDYTYTAIVLPDTTILEFSVQGPDPAIAALLANSIGQRAVDFIQSLYQVYNLTILDPAVSPFVPIRPQPLQNTAIAFVIGIALGAAFALVRELLIAPIENFFIRRLLDDMSQAMNRPTFEKKLAEITSGSTPDFSLCMVRLEGLSDYINVLPLPTLQTILRHISQTLKNQLRGNDIVGRWDDIDFSVLLSETPGDGALNTMGRVRTALSVPIKLDVSGEDLYLKPQIGIAEYRVGDTSQSIVKNTEWALDIAKKGDDNIYLLKTNQPI